MSSDLYEVISLAARYLFAFLGVVIVLRSFLWLFSDRAEKRRRLRRLPDSGNIGEMVVLSGSPELPEGTSLPVPWEGVLGSVRSCDIVVPCEGVRKRHLRFSYTVGKGLQILPASGCEAAVDSVTLDCRSGERGAPMVHGSFLQVGSALLRLRVFAELDSAAGFDPSSSFNSEPFDIPQAGYPTGIPGEAAQGDPALTGQGLYEGAPFPAPPPGGDPAMAPSQDVFMPQPGGPGTPGIPPQPWQDVPDTNAVNGETAAAITGDRPADAGTDPHPEEVSAAGRKRRRARWEEDWSE